MYTYRVCSYTFYIFSISPLYGMDVKSKCAIGALKGILDICHHKQHLVKLYIHLNGPKELTHLDGFKIKFGINT